MAVWQGLLTSRFKGINRLDLGGDHGMDEVLREGEFSPNELGGRFFAVMLWKALENARRKLNVFGLGLGFQCLDDGLSLVLVVNELERLLDSFLIGCGDGNSGEQLLIRIGGLGKPGLQVLEPTRDMVEVEAILGEAFLIGLFKKGPGSEKGLIEGLCPQAQRTRDEEIVDHNDPCEDHGSLIGLGPSEKASHRTIQFEGGSSSSIRWLLDRKFEGSSSADASAFSFLGSMGFKVSL